jgi:hypothetical protein
MLIHISDLTSKRIDKKNSKVENKNSMILKPFRYYKDEKIHDQNISSSDTHAPELMIKAIANMHSVFSKLTGNLPTKAIDLRHSKRLPY